MPSKPHKLGPITRTIALNVHLIRTADKLSFNELSKRLNKLDTPIAPLGLRRIEQGLRRIDVDEAVALADALHIPFAALLDASGPNEHRKECLRWLLAEVEWRADH